MVLYKLLLNNWKYIGSSYRYCKFFPYKFQMIFFFKYYLYIDDLNNMEKDMSKKLKLGINGIAIILLYLSFCSWSKLGTDFYKLLFGLFPTKLWNQESRDSNIFLICFFLVNTLDSQQLIIFVPVTVNVVFRKFLDGTCHPSPSLGPPVHPSVYYMDYF